VVTAVLAWHNLGRRGSFPVRAMSIPYIQF
jgi:hypothetical protein